MELYLALFEPETELTKAGFARRIGIPKTHMEGLLSPASLPSGSASGCASRSGMRRRRSPDSGYISRLRGLTP